MDTGVFVSVTLLPVLMPMMLLLLVPCVCPVLLIASVLRYLNVNHPPWRRACSTRKVLYMGPDARSSDSSYLSFMGM